MKSFVRLTSVPSGIETDRVLTTRIALPDTRYPDRAAITAFFGEYRARARAPRSACSRRRKRSPARVFSGDWGFDIEGRSRVNGRRPGAAMVRGDAGYFESLGVPLRRGRLPADSDTSAAPPVVFVNETTARVLFPSTDPIGKRIRLSNTTGAEQPWRTIAGIVATSGIADWIHRRALNSSSPTSSSFTFRRACRRAHEPRHQDRWRAAGECNRGSCHAPRARSGSAGRTGPRHVDRPVHVGGRPPAQYAARRGVWRPGAAARGDRALRRDGLYRFPTHTRSRSPDCTRGDARSRTLARCWPGSRAGARWPRDRRRPVAARHRISRPFTFRRGSARPDDLRRCAGRPPLDRSGGELPSGSPGGARRPAHRAAIRARAADYTDSTDRVL